MEYEDESVVLFYPYIPSVAADFVSQTLNSRWIGQGPQVDIFEQEFKNLFQCKEVVSVNSGTSALHLAYILAGVSAGDEVICPLFTCSATNIPLLHMGARPVFVDVDPTTMNIDVEDLKRRITDRCKAIVTVDFGGLPCDYSEIQEIATDMGIPVIQDAAHSLGSSYMGKVTGTFSDITVFSFQAIKHITTGDGGMLTFRDSKYSERAKRLRWFGIDRTKKSGGVWENDILEAGFKYHMNDIAASIGIASLKDFHKIKLHRNRLNDIYFEELSQVSGVYSAGRDSLSDRTHASWIHTIIVEERDSLRNKLLENGIETGPVHYRNDRYTIFRDSQSYFPGMDKVENSYLALPIHMKVSEEDVLRITSLIREGW